MSNNINHFDKHLNLCFTHVSTGFCPYGNRCDFIHDPRVSGEIKSGTKLKDIKTNDNLVYWPKNNKKSKSPNIEYEVSCTQNKDKYTKSIWNSFVKYLDNDTSCTKENRNFNKIKKGRLFKDKSYDSYKFKEKRLFKGKSYDDSYKFKDKSNNDSYKSKNIRILKR